MTKKQHKTNDAIEENVAFAVEDKGAGRLEVVHWAGETAIVQTSGSYFSAEAGDGAHSRKFGDVVAGSAQKAVADVVDQTSLASVHAMIESARDGFERTNMKVRARFVRRFHATLMTPP